ncbi:membrane protein insertase YidC [Humisphaera borealis]|uniref:Membrane protein insertase YidC n=1 Tax=Humisphaera borealis TaxID=2807512 RepID=A0A7M2X0K0_9BACT|nr:membrane protein insertase YidC [Humisphaera borealis]QOV91179.1 membrane protein insertase YidC [Humisphaera borealis]
MPKKQTIVAILLSVAVMAAWIGARAYYQKYHPEYFAPATPPVVDPVPAATSPVATTLPATGATAVVSATLPSATQTAVGPSVGPSVGPAAPAVPAGLSVAPVAAEDLKGVQLGSATIDDPKFVMQLSTAGIGGAIDAIILNPFRRGEDFKKEPKDRGTYVFQKPYDQGLYSYTRPMATRSITIDGQILDLSNAKWAFKSQGENERTLLAPGQPGGKATLKGPSVTYTTTILRAGQPILELTKTFTIFEKTSITAGYEVAIDFAMRNLTAGELSVQSVINGPTLPPPEAARPPDRNVMAGYRLKDGALSYPGPHPVSVFNEGSPTYDLTKDKEGNAVAWAGCSSVYFNAFVLFEQPSQIAKVAAEAKRVVEEKDPEHRPVLMTFETVPAKLAAGESHAMSVSAFFGPRWRDVLNQPFYSGATRGYDQTLIVKSGPCGFCAVDQLISGMVGLLNGLHWVAGGFPPIRNGDWGIAIILLVAIVRTLLHPITKRSQIQLMKMGKMGPEMAKLKEKYGDDKEAFTKAQMTLMKEQGLGPLLGCLPMFLQMPIWIALWQALQSTFELRQAPFLWHWTWIEDLSKPDYLFKFEHSYPLFFGIVLDGFNLLPILLSIVFHVQARIQNSLSVASTPEQESQKKMMMWMSTLLFPLFLYNGPSGLNLYILTSTFVGMVESKIIRDHIKQKEEAEKLLAPVVVDAKPTRAARRADGKPEEPAAPKTGIAGFFQKLQSRVEEIQKDQEKQQKKGKKQ